ncbi:MAG: hypothetical protein RID81_07245 [Sandaracinaceae bacterium]
MNRAPFLALALALSLLSGCAGALRTSSIGAHATGIALGDVGETIELERHRAQLAAVEGAEYREDADAAVDEVRRAWAPAVSAYDAAREVYNGWIDVLRAAKLAGLEDPVEWARIAARAVRAYGALADALRALGHEVPALPGVVTDLADTIAGEPRAED